MLSIFTIRQCSWLLILTLYPSSKYFILCRTNSALQDTRAAPKSPKPCMRFKSWHRETPGRHLGEAGRALTSPGKWWTLTTDSDNGWNNWCSESKSILSFWKVLFPNPVRFLKNNTFGWVLICSCCCVVFRFGFFFFVSEKNLAPLALISSSLNFKKHIITVK